MDTNQRGLGKKPELLFLPKMDTWYTDGSGANGRFETGFYGMGTNHREYIPMGELATVFQAEVLAILECARLQISNETRNKKIRICTDSRAAIGALAKTTTESSLGLHASVGKTRRT